MFHKVVGLCLLLFIVLLLYLEKPDIIIDRWPIRLGSSPVHGRGMYATRDIRRGETIEIAPLLGYLNDDIAKDCIIKDYAILLDDKVSAIMLGHVSLYNHMDDNNANWIILKPSESDIIVYAKKDIKAGDEIFVNYGPKYWNHRKGKINEISGSAGDPVPEESPTEPPTDQCQSECP
jgi:SET domain-containing protein